VLDRAYGTPSCNRWEEAVPQSIQDFIDTTGIVDVHEHHFPEILLGREVNLLQLFRQSYAGWTEGRPYALPSESRDSNPELAPDTELVPVI
jgi:hypothetical protein